MPKSNGTKGIAETPSQIGKRLEEARKAARLSRPAVAKAVGYDPQSVYRWEREARRVPGAALLKMLSLYGLDPSDLGLSEGGEIGTMVPRGTKPSATAADGWSPNPALRGQIPQRAYEVALGHLRRLAAAGIDPDQIEEAERLMIDRRFAKANKRERRELSEDDWILLVDDAWDAIREVLSWKGVKV